MLFSLVQGNVPLQRGPLKIFLEAPLYSQVRYLSAFLGSPLYLIDSRGAWITAASDLGCVT